MIIDAHRPIADGIPFSDTMGMSVEIVNRLASRGVVFMTEFDTDDATYGGNIIAKDWKSAERIAFGRGLGERVVGRLVRAARTPRDLNGD